MCVKDDAYFRSQGGRYMNRHPLLDVERIEQAPDVYLNSIGSVFAAFDERSQDSGNMSYGVQTPEGCYFVKTAGYPDDPNPFLSHSERASLLRNAIWLWRSCDHRTLPPLHQVIESPNGPLLVYQWMDGELVRVDAAIRNDPRSTFQRFRRLPSHEIIRALDLVYELHHQLATVRVDCCRFLRWLHDLRLRLSGFTYCRPRQLL